MPFTAIDLYHPIGSTLKRRGLPDVPPPPPPPSIYPATTLFPSATVYPKAG